MASYIVRIYRRHVGEEEIVGTVAAPGREGRTPFHSFQELKAILLQEEADETPASRSSRHVRDDQ